MDDGRGTRADAGGRWTAGKARRLTILAIALGPALGAIWAFPGFVTQDGPAHLYNASVLAASFDPASPLRDTFAVRWEPLPNWAGHLVLMGWLRVLPPRAADRAMTTTTLVVFATALVWLRWKVAGERGLAAAAVLAVVLALNITWLFGFTSFSLGAACFPITLGSWWSGRDGGFSWTRASGLAALMVLGYFCHLVSLGLTAFALIVLEVATPGRDRRARAAATALGLAPLLPLGGLYLRLMRRGGGGLAPEWAHLWVGQLTWVDPISLARKDWLPLSDDRFAPGLALFAPVVWLAAGLVLAVWAGWRETSESTPERRGWWVLAALLLVGGVVSPDTLGLSHGHYLPQRIVLLALAAVLPVLRFDKKAAGLIVVAWLLQSAIVWSYARHSEQTAGRVIRAGQALGRGQRIAALWIDTTTRFRANPLLHADCALGVGTHRVIWGDYETRFYYFPVRFRDGLDHPDPAELEWIALHKNAPDRTRRWADLLDRYQRVIDALIVWGDDPALDAVNARWYRPVFHDGPVRVLRRSEASR